MRFEHPAQKMFGKLADLKVERDDAAPGPRADLDGAVGHLINSMPIVREYVKHRVAGIHAITAWRWAKSTVTRSNDEPEGFNTNGHAFEVDGFDIEIDIEPDYDPDYSFYGEFVDSWKPGAIQNPDGWTSHGNRNHHFMAYFVPAYTEEERYNDLHKTGMDKQSARLEARKFVLETIKNASDYAPQVAVVKASRYGVELGSDVLGDLDYDNPEDAIFEHGMIDNAIEEAKKAIAKLIESTK